MPMRAAVAVTPPSVGLGSGAARRRAPDRTATAVTDPVPVRPGAAPIELPESGAPGLCGCGAIPATKARPPAGSYVAGRRLSPPHGPGHSPRGGTARAATSRLPWVVRDLRPIPDRPPAAQSQPHDARPRRDRGPAGAAEVGGPVADAGDDGSRGRVDGQGRSAGAAAVGGRERVHEAARPAVAAGDAPRRRARHRGRRLAVSGGGEARRDGRPPGDGARGGIHRPQAFVGLQHQEAPAREGHAPVRTRARPGGLPDPSPRPGPRPHRQAVDT